MKYFFLFSLMLSICATCMCQENSAPPKPLMELPEISTFAALGKKAGLESFFQGTGPFTAFVPENRAFEKMDQKLLDELQKPENLDRLIDFINYHVILGAYRSQSLKPKKYRTVNGKDINIKISDGDIYVNDAKVVRKDVVGPNGVGYIIDKVLIP